MSVRPRATHGDRSRELLRRYQLLEPLLPGESAKAVFVRWDPTANEGAGGYVAGDESNPFTLWSFASARDSAGELVEVNGVETQVGGQGYCARMHDRARWEAIECPPGPQLFGPYTYEQTLLSAGGPQALTTFTTPWDGLFDFYAAAAIGSVLEGAVVVQPVLVRLFLGAPSFPPGGIPFGEADSYAPTYTLTSGAGSYTVPAQGTPAEGFFLSVPNLGFAAGTQCVLYAQIYDGGWFRAITFWAQAQLWVKARRYF